MRRRDGQVRHIFHAFFHANSKPAVMAAHHVHRYLPVFLQGRTVKRQGIVPHRQRDLHAVHFHAGPRPGAFLFHLHIFLLIWLDVPQAAARPRRPPCRSPSV